MRIVIIAALAADGTIGDHGKIPWRLAADLQRFKRTTIGHPVIMGRHTFQSLDRPLPGRPNLVLSRNPSYRAPAGVRVFPSLEVALEDCRRQGEPTAFVIGGAAVYRQALPVADRLLLTHVRQPVSGDTRFPEFDRSEWREIAREDTAECSFVEYERRPAAAAQP